MTYGSLQGPRRRGEDPPEELKALCHDLQQCVVAGLLLTEMPTHNHLDQETRRRFDLLRQTLSHAGELLEQATVVEPPELSLLDLTELAQRCADAAEYRHKIPVQNETGIPAIVSAEPILLQRAIDNLIDNAARAAGEHGAVVIRIGTTDDEAWVAVADDGPGFGRIEHGSGQGLSVVNSAVRACNGRLDITSAADIGTAVHIILPRQDEPDDD